MGSEMCIRDRYNANDIITGLRFDAANLPNATFEIDSISAAE